MHLQKSQKLYIILLSIFLTFLIMAEVTGAKLIRILGFTLTFGVIPFPVTFLVTDLLNEYFGRKMVRRTTWIGMVMVLLVYVLIVVGMLIPAIPESPVNDEAFQMVFANSGMIIVGSIIAYVIGQLIDIQVFHRLRVLTKGKLIWLRSTGSTIISQLIDSFVVIFIAFGAKLSFEKLVAISTNNFAYKLLVAIALTPLIYLGHSLINSYLGEEKDELLKHALEEKPK